MIAFAPGTILDSSGEPLPKTKKRVELAEAFASVNQKQGRQVRATYDAARSIPDHQNYWSNADTHDADSANSREVRKTLVTRSRYDVANNGFSAGIARTVANDLIGVGPTLRMQTGSEGFNRLVEREWNKWCKETQFRRKLWCQAHAKHQDGESFAVIRQNRNLRHPIKLDLRIYETEQVQTPYAYYAYRDEKGWVDGIRFDEFDNPISYDVLKRHPGNNRYIRYDDVPESVPARYMLHWFKMLRPGQHRGVPEMASTLNLGASSRRWREAVVGAAENLADISILLKTTLDPDEVDAADPMSTFEFQKRMMTALPMGYEMQQPKPEQPTANHAEFNKAQINEQARPISMPYNKAACDSSDYNFASGKLDHSTYYGSLNVDRCDIDDLILDPLFDVWFERAIMVYGWIGGNPDAVNSNASNHTWDWPKHQVADNKSEAQANEMQLRTGVASLTSIHAANGEDYVDLVAKAAESNGITEEQQRQINLLRNVPQHAINHVAAIIGLAPQAQGASEMNQQSQEQEQNDARE